MKKTRALFYITVVLVLMGPLAFAQNNYADSAKAALSAYTKPLERFSATINYLETIDSRASNNIVSAICIDLLQKKSIEQLASNDKI